MTAIRLVLYSPISSSYRLPSLLASVCMPLTHLHARWTVKIVCLLLLTTRIMDVQNALRTLAAGAKAATDKRYRGMFVYPARGGGHCAKGAAWA